MGEQEQNHSHRDHFLPKEKCQRQQKTTDSYRDRERGREICVIFIWLITHCFAGHIT